MKGLEIKYGFRLCIHYRDFPVGYNVAATIVEKMTQSREIIIILSDIALKSEWCQFELDEAQLQMGHRQKSMIIITLGDIRINCLNAKVAHLLDNHTFLKWSESNPKASKLFWSQLVARLYNDPRGESCFCSCCCLYGARALGYQHIFDTMASGEQMENDHQVFHLAPH
jgi:toll-like receptor 13